ncbi:hypothetical protein B0T10DRAFT_590096 [Thelonectria olida]|uniref:Uncharacterized protein n=1 Tax=Thelonectria olida TaxID=1576542 RepID=A0A9P8WAY3_9HYPO|nr:hypothetical protein B0T10DRAFT_590096 [Thelonectria olida]
MGSKTTNNRLDNQPGFDPESRPNPKVATSSASQGGSKFKEVTTPTQSLLMHPSSMLLEGLDESQLKVREAVPPELMLPNTLLPPQTMPKKPLPQVNLQDRLDEKSSLFGTQKDLELFEFGKHRAAIAGYMAPSYVLPGDEFLSALVPGNREADVKMEYDSLWLQVQLFWDLMLRLQPNPITADRVQVHHAVELMTDSAAGRLMAETRLDYDPETALQNVRELRRRLQTLELVLRSAMNTCGKDHKILCGCTIALKRYKDKQSLWSRLFGGDDKDTRESNRSFKVRDVACLLRLEDFLTHVSRDFERQVQRRAEDETLAMTAMGFMDKQIAGLICGKSIRSVGDLKKAWVNVLCNAGFRRAVAHEVGELVSEAVAFRKTWGVALHRDGCDQKVDRKPGLLRQLSMASLREASKDGKLPTPSPFRTMFKKS